MDNKVSKNTIIFGDNNSSGDSNIDRIDRLVLEKSKESSFNDNVDSGSSVKRGAINFGARNVSFSKTINDNIKRIDSLVDAMSRESNNISELDVKKIVKKNTIVFGDDRVESFDTNKKYIRRGKINIKDGYSDINSDDEVIEGPREVRGASIVSYDDVLEVESKKSGASDIENKVDSNIKLSDKVNNVNVMLVMILVLLVIVLVGVFLILYMVTSGNM